MFDGHALLRSEKVRAGVTMAFGLLLLLEGVTGIRLDRYLFLDFFSRRRWYSQSWSIDNPWLNWLLVFAGFSLLVWGFVRWHLLSTRQKSLEAVQDHRFFLRAGAPRAIHGLLLQVAARNGEVTQRERDLVHRILLHDLTDKVVPQDLVNWSTKPADRDPVVSAKMLAAILEPSERLQVLRWCEKVAEADGKLDDHEAALLIDLERVLRSPTPGGATRRVP
jgi:uncharacterized tellurite resistance protein B-like protein